MTMEQTAPFKSSYKIVSMEVVMICENYNLVYTYPCIKPTVDPVSSI